MPDVSAFKGTKLSTVRDPSSFLNACNPSSLEDFKLIPEIARRAICTLYSGLQDLQSKQNRGAYTFVSQLVRVGPLLITILSYESSRQKSFWRRRGASFYVILAQLLSGAVSVPLYFATLCYGEADQTSRKEMKKREEVKNSDKTPVSGTTAWSIFTSVTVGYLVPLAYGIYSHWSNRSITTFLGFPIYVMTINTLLPLVLQRRFRQNAPSPQLPLLITAGISTLLSLDGHLKLLFSGIPLKHIFWPSQTAIGMTQDLHMLLLHDYAFVLLELASFVFLYTYRSATKREKMKAVKLGAAISLLAGPIAGLSIIWTMKELEDLSANKRTEIISEDSERTRLLDDDADK